MKTTTIADLLSWAFIFELPKVKRDPGRNAAGIRSAWSSVQQFGELGTLIDRSPNAHGVIPTFFDEGEPHPDALAVAAAVRDLALVRFDIPAGWNPFPEFDDPHGLIAAETATVVDEVQQKGDLLAGKHIVALVTSAAVLRRGPDWFAEQPSFQMVSRYGKPLWFVRKQVRDQSGNILDQEVDGLDRSKGRPLPGAYRRYELSEPLRSDILSRLDWQLWQDALACLTNSLSGRLHAYRVLEFLPHRSPWYDAASPLTNQTTSVEMGWGA